MNTLPFPKAANLIFSPADFERMDAVNRIRQAHDIFENRLILTTSFGIQSAVLLHMATKAVPKIPVVFVDTGYLPPETYQFAKDLTGRLGLNLHTYTPVRTAAMQEALDGKRWEKDAAAKAAYNLENKVEPMNRAVKELGASAWLSGVRAAQSEHRASLDVLETKNAFTKIYPIIDWSDNDVDAYLKENDLPYHPYHAYGYKSVGDYHSSAPDQQRLECGLHDEKAVPRPLNYEI